MSWAHTNGHEGIVQLLKDKGATMNGTVQVGYYGAMICNLPVYGIDKYV